MGLPQELVDHIMDMLHDDLPTLKACSLTCKAMVASTRRLIHQTLWLTDRNNKSVLTLKEKFRRMRRDPDVQLRFLSCVGERGLLQYVRRVNYNIRYLFIPRILELHLHHFKSLDHVHTLTLTSFSVDLWENDYKTDFLHFYPTLTSLTLHKTFGPYRLLLQFALQFPNLENLCIETLYGLVQGEPAIPADVDQSPHSRKHLRLVGEDIPIAVGSAPGLPNRANFWSVELEDFFGVHAQDTLDACACTLEKITIIPRWFGYVDLQHLNFAEIKALRQFVLRMEFDEVSNIALDHLIRPLLTIASPIFCEFVLELSELPPHFYWASFVYWDNWDVIDELLDERFADRKDFKLIVRTSKLHDQETFQRHAKETFSLLAGRGCIHFEENYLV